MNATKPVFYKPIVHEFPVEVKAPVSVPVARPESKKPVHETLKWGESKIVGVSNLREGSIVSGKK